MSFAASGTEGAEATIVVRAWREDVRWVAVQVHAVGGIGAIKGTAVVRAIGHSASIERSQIITIPLLLYCLRLSIYTQERVIGEEGENPQVIFMQELALISLLA